MPDYDLQHCVRGLRVIDLYVLSAQRGGGIGAMLLAHVAAEAVRSGCEYLRGEAAPSPVSRHLFDRIAQRFGESYTVSVVELRALAQLCAAPPREIVRRCRALHERGARA